MDPIQFKQFEPFKSGQQFYIGASAKSDNNAGT
jgi:hypothetical protein